MTRYIISMVMTSVLIIGVQFSAAGESTFEFYAKTTPNTLREQTSEMGSKLRKAFSQDAIKTQQQKIDFAEYFSHLKKTVLYATKLSTYSEYEKDLRFAKDKEIFKGLPGETNRVRGNAPELDRKEFVQNKYGQMKKNIGEEIETYDDLIRLSLDTCETLVDNDLSGILDDSENQKKIKSFVQSEMYRKFKVKKVQFGNGWPELSTRLSAQLVLWTPNPPSIDDPIIDPRIVGAI